MRILITSHYWRPHRGGIETVAYEQAWRLAHLGHHVSVVTSQLPGDMPEERGSITLHRVPVWNILEEGPGIPYPLFTPRLFALLNRLIPDQDVVLAHGHVYLPSVEAAVLCRRHGKPLVLFQESPFVEYRFPWNAVERIADRTLGVLTLRSASRLLALSRHTARYVKTLAPGRPISVLYHGVDSSRFFPPSGEHERAELRRRLGLPENSFVVLSIRRLVYRNGLDVLLAAAAELSYRRDIHFVIGGQGPQRPLLERTIRDQGLEQCHLVGPIEDERVPLFYRAADVFALPTRTGEGFGLVLLEAFASGIPAVVAWGGGQDEAVRAGGDGVLVPPEDPAALAAAIERLATDSTLRREMGERALRRAQALDWHRQAEQISRILQDVAQRGPSCSGC